ncbi:hypothetical protein V6R21_20120 [Limibacter armeniacum]|uniref:hypothetical protein n=1 Tax=Limibacter armeniacum TaxID=466084 RepID=UPI002FE6252B
MSISITKRLLPSVGAGGGSSVLYINNDESGAGSPIGDDLYARLDADNLSLVNKDGWKSALGYVETADIDNRYLKIESNLSDLADKSVARTNLEVFSKTETDSRYLQLTGGTITGDLSVQGLFTQNISSGGKYINGLATARNYSSFNCFYILIDTGQAWGNIMQSLTLELYNYSSNDSAKLHISGYAYSGSGNGGYWLSKGFTQIGGRVRYQYKVGELANGNTGLVIYTQSLAYMAAKLDGLINTDSLNGTYAISFHVDEPVLTGDVKGYFDADWYGKGFATGGDGTIDGKLSFGDIELSQVENLGTYLNIYDKGSGKNLSIGAGISTYARYSTDSTYGHLFSQDVTIDGTVKSYSSIVSEGFELSRSGNSRIGKLNITTTVGSESFASGFAGNGWRIDTDTNTATFDNLVVRRSMRVYELEINKIRASNGSLWVSDACVIENIVVATANTTVRVYPDNPNAIPFVIGDIVRIQNFSGNNILAHQGRVYAFSGDGLSFYVNFVEAAYNEGLGYPSDVTKLKGMTMVRVDSTVTNRKGALYLTSSDTGSPYLDVVNGFATNAQPIKVRLGRLDGITSSVFGTLSGYGLFAENAYLEGTVVAGSGKIASFNIDSSTIWSGNKYGNGNGGIEIKNDGGSKRFMVHKDPSNYAMLYQYDYDDTWGLIGRVNNSSIFQLGSTNKVAGWNFDSSKLYSGNLELESSGQIRHTSDIWRLNNDGSGQVAGGKISWDINGKLTLDRDSLIQFSSPNLMYFDWSTQTLGNAHNVSDKVDYYNSTRNYITNNLSSEGFTDRASEWTWVVDSVDSSSWNGGFKSQPAYVKLDTSQKYMIAFWVNTKHVGNNTSGTSNVYFGMLGEIQTTSSSTTNFYFNNRAASTIDSEGWQLWVGYVHPYGTVASSMVDDGGMYLMDGTKLGDSSKGAFAGASTSYAFRIALYRQQTGGKAFFQSPMVFKCDGTEPSIQDLLKGAGNVNGTYIDSNGIYTGTLNASQITAGQITADKINANGLNVTNGTFNGTLSAVTGVNQITNFRFEANDMIKASGSLATSATLINALGSATFRGSDGEDTVISGSQIDCKDLNVRGTTVLSATAANTITANKITCNDSANVGTLATGISTTSSSTTTTVSVGVTWYFYTGSNTKSYYMTSSAQIGSIFFFSRAGSGNIRLYPPSGHTLYSESNSIISYHEIGGSFQGTQGVVKTASTTWRIVVFF